MHLDLSYTVKVYSNPTKELLSIKSEVRILGMSLYNLYGALIVDGLSGDSDEVDVSALPSGMYLLKVQLSGYKNPQLIKFSKF